MKPKCAGTTSKGPCAFAAWGASTYCAACSARAGEPEGVAEMARRGQKGMAQQIANREARKRAACRLRSTDDLLSELERQVVKVEASGAEAVAKAGTIVKLVAEARATLKAELLEKENADLRALLVERHPELAKHLRAVK